LASNGSTGSLLNRWQRGAEAVKAAIASEWEDLLEDEGPFDDATVLVLEHLR
jgi:hypothetical protein